jgi:hypothetical protein
VILGGKRHVEALPLDVFDHNGDGVEDEHQAGNGPLEIAPHGLLEALDLDGGVRCGHDESGDEGEKCAWGMPRRRIALRV